MRIVWRDPPASLLKAVRAADVAAGGDLAGLRVARLRRVRARLARDLEHQRRQYVRDVLTVLRAHGVIPPG